MGIYKKFRVFFLLTTISIVLFACNDNTTTQQEQSETNDNSQENVDSSSASGGDIHVAVNAQPPTLDPHMTTADATSEVARHIFEQLMTLNSNYEPVPMLAQSVEVNDDNTAFTFNLRKGVIFHNGDEMNADDVVASLNRWKEKSSSAKTIIGDALFEAKDDYTVSLELDKPASILLNVIATDNQFSAIMPKEVIESASTEGVTEYIGTGPFKFVEWKQDEYVHLTKFEDYQPVDSEPDGLAGKKEALLDNIYFQIVVDDSTRVAGIQSGEYDVAVWMPRDNYRQLESAPNVVNSIDLYGGHSVVFNKKEGVMSDPIMRQAVNAGLDMGAILLASFASEEFYRLDPGLMYQEQTQWYTDVGSENYNQKDLEKAKQLLDQAGYNGEKIRILASRDYVHVYNAAIVIEEQLSEIMNIEVEVYDWPTVVEKRDDPTQYEMFVTGFSTVTNPAQLLPFSPDFPGWMDDPEINSLMKEISEATNHEDAKEAFAKVQERNWNEYLSYIKLGDFYNLTSYQTYVEGLNYFEGIMLWNTTISK